MNCAEYEYLSTKQSPTLGGGIIRHFDQTYSALEHSVFCIFLPGAAGMGHRCIAGAPADAALRLQPDCTTSYLTTSICCC